MTATFETASAPGTRLGSPAPSTQRFSTPPPPPSSAVPTDFRSSLSAWWNNTSYKEARLAEERLLRRMAHFRPLPPPVEKGWFGRKQEGSNGNEVQEVVEPLGTEHGLVATLRNVFIPTPDPSLAPAHPADPAGSSPAPSIASTDSKRKQKEKALVDYINTLEISKSGDDSKQAVVVLHGYAAALGFFFRNWESVADQTASIGKRTFFLDWLGMGLSSRPSSSLMSGPSPTTDPAIAVPQRVSRAEHFFVSSLESWRQAVGLEKMVLVGHSLGGYLASAYAVRYPSRVAGLVLVSPAGIPHGPEYTKYQTSAERATVGMNAGDLPRSGSPSLEPAADAAAKELDEDGANFEPKGEAKNWKNNREQSMFRRNATKFFVWGWERGISPFSFLRGMGPFGPMFAGKYSLRRFGSQSEEDVRDIHAYIYNTSMLKGSGEYCISHILAPGAYARIPIVDRIGALKVPVTFIYGDNDWMDLDGGKASVRALAKAGNNDASVHVVAKAGHHVYLDNPDDTNKIIGDAIKAVQW